VSSFIIFNGSIVPSGTPIITADNRGFRYGDGLFETIRVKDGRIVLGKYHFDRLISGARLLQFEISSFLSAEKLSAEILELCRRNGHERSARVRLNVFRADMGQESGAPQHVIQSWELETGEEAEKGVTLGIYPHGRKSCDQLSNIKSNNYLVYSMGARYAGQHGWDDSLVLNSFGRVADSSIANLFLVKGGIVYTPPLSEGCVAGVMRRWLIQVLPEKGWEVREQPAAPEDLLQADELFLSNAIRGSRWVGKLAGVTYGNKIAQAVKKIIDEDLC